MTELSQGIGQRLNGKVCIVTGSAQGMGFVIAKRYAEEGAKVVIADIDESGAMSVAAELSAAGYETFGSFVDISQMDSTDALAKSVHARFGRIDVLLNNAAIYRGIQHADTTDEYLDKIVQVNLWGAWRMSHSVVPIMLAQHSGKIINQGSDAAYFYSDAVWPTVDNLPNFSYGISKWGIHGMTKFMAGTLGPHGINVNCISPGVILTEATKEVMSEEMISGMAATVIPLRRALQPEDVAGTAVFFASADSDLVTGQILCVDGGMIMNG